MLVIGVAACGRVDFGPVARDGAPVDDVAADADTLGVGLVLHLPFEGNTSDTSQGLPVLCADCPTYAPGHVGQAARFASPICLTVAGSQPGLQAPAYTLAAWVQTTVVARGVVLSRPFDGETDVTNSWELFLREDGTVRFTTLIDGVNDYPGGGPYSIDIWHHVAAVHDGRSKRIYLDGAQVSVTPAPPTEYDASDVFIGCDRNLGALEGFFRGLLDEVRVYDRALSEDEVRALAAQ